MESFLGYTSLQTGMGQQGLQNVNTSHTTQQVSSDAMLQQLQPGDTFQGEIMSVTGQDVQLQLANGMYMTAKLEGEVQLALGQLLNFQVQSNQNSKIVLKPIYTNLLQQRVGEAALKAANIAVNEKNLQMVSKLIENGMSIDKNSLTVFNRQLLQHPQVSADSLIRLQQLGVKITDANLVQLEHYQNLEHKLADGIQEAVEDIGRLYEKIAENADAGNTDIAGNADMTGHADIAGNTDTTVNAGIVKAGVFMEQIVCFLAEEGSNSDKESQVLLHNPTTQQGSVSNSNQIIKLLKYMNQLEGLPEEQIVGKLKEGLKQGELDVSLLKELLFSEKGIGEKLSTESRDKLYRSEELGMFLKDTLQKEWALVPDELTEDGKVKEFYQKLLQQTEQLSKIMEQTASQSQTNTGNSLQNIRENVEFMNQINQMFQYVQLPLKMSGSQAQGELYVYTNKRNLAKKDGMLTAILHLDMEYLGNMDINISLNTNTEQVITRFYMEEDAMELMEENMEELTQRLVKKGYQSQTFFEKRESEKTVFERIEEQAKGMSAPLVYQNFDIRT